MTRFARVGLVLTLLTAGACHTMRFEAGPGPVSSVVKERKSFFLWGLTPEKHVDVLEKCPNGVVAIEEETNFVDGLCELITLGIWSPRSSSYHCK